MIIIQSKKDKSPTYYVYVGVAGLEPTTSCSQSTHSTN